MANSKFERRLRRHRRVRKTMEGTAQRPRLAVYRSLNHIHAQLIDDSALNGSGRTLVAASTIKVAVAQGEGKKARAKALGKELAERAVAAGIKRVVFDRGGFIYHGRVQALAEGAREGGLEF